MLENKPESKSIAATVTYCQMWTSHCSLWHHVWCSLAYLVPLQSSVEKQTKHKSSQCIHPQSSVTLHHVLNLLISQYNQIISSLVAYQWQAQSSPGPVDRRELLPQCVSDRTGQISGWEHRTLTGGALVSSRGRVQWQSGCQVIQTWPVKQIWNWQEIADPHEMPSHSQIFFN